MKSFILVCSLIFAERLLAYELAIGSMFRNTAPYLKEWVEYHRLVGVDHFWLYNDASTDNWEEVLEPYILEGIVEVIYWPAGKPYPFHVERQIEAFNDATQRAIGVAKWIALIDQDEFLLPMQDKTVTECLSNRYTAASAVYVNWRTFGTGGVFLKKEEPMLSRLTACSPWRDGSNVVGKSIVRPECVLSGKIWYVHHCPLTEGSRYFDGNGRQTLRNFGFDWITDGLYHEANLRINHYIFRDEKYFKEEKLPTSYDLSGMLRLYENCTERDETILNYLRKNHPEKYKEIWEAENGH